MSLQPRPELAGIDPGSHGGLDYSELRSRGLAADRVLDFSVCCNPYPPHQAVRNSLRRLPLDRYPDSSTAELCTKLAEKLGLAPGHLMAGNGTTELIRLIAFTFFRPGDRVLLFRPTYGEYGLASRLAGAEVIELPGQAEQNYRLPAEELASSIRLHRPRAVFLCNPNNPTGQYLSRQELEIILRSCDDCWLILDEAYVNFVDRPWPSLELIRQGNVIILRSMTKDYSLAGLRLGYMAASEDTISAVRRVCPPWNVNIAAQKAGAAALDCDDFLRQSLTRIYESGRHLRREMSRLGFTPLPSAANFFLVPVNNGKLFRQALLRAGILVRDCASFGLPGYVRIAPRSMSHCRQFIRAVRSLKQEGKI